MLIHNSLVPKAVLLENALFSFLAKWKFLSLGLGLHKQQNTSGYNYV
jgi:hypothetical protein